MNGFVDQGLDEDNFAQSSSGVISSFDAFPKTKQTYLTQTRNGGAWTLAIAVFCLWLTSTEFWRWMEGTTMHHFSVEKGVAHDLQINIDVVVAMKCDEVAINVQDASGDRVLASEMLSLDPTRWNHWKGGLKHDTWGRKIHPQTGEQEILRRSAQQFMEIKNEDVHDYLAKAKAAKRFTKTPRLGWHEEADSCRVWGSVEGNKVQGDFHITARGHGYADLSKPHLDHHSFNFSHHINELSFGSFFPSIVQPLDQSISITELHFYKYQYYLSVVPTIYTDAAESLESSKRKLSPRLQAEQRTLEAALRKPEHERTRNEWWAINADTRRKASPSEPNVARDRRASSRLFSLFSSHTVYTNQYAVTEQSRSVPETSVPGIFFKYDIEPILLTVSEEWGGALGLIIRCVNVVAGVLVAGSWLVALSEWASDVLGRRRRRGLSLGSGGGLLSPNEKTSMD